MKKRFQEGFTLVEIVIALILMSGFSLAFLMNQSGNFEDSNRMREELILHQLCKSKINETLMNLPEFNNATENDIEEKDFEDDFTNYRYKVEFKKFVLPDFQKLLSAQQAASETEEDTSANEGVDQTSQAYITKVFEKIKLNLENMIWQVRVTVWNKETERSFSLSTWVDDKQAKLDVQL